MNVLNGAGSGTWLVQRHHDAVAQAAAGMGGTRVGRAGEPDILAATSGWQQGRAAQKRPDSLSHEKTPRRAGAFKSASLAAAFLLGAGSRSRGLGLLRVVVMLLRMLPGVMLGLRGLVLGRHRSRGLGRGSLIGGRRRAGRGGLGGKRRDRESGRDDGGKDQLTHCNGLLE